MKFGNEFWLILFWEYISPNLFAVRFVQNPFFLMAGAFLFVEKIRQRASLYCGWIAGC
jgi:hypothetical protein